MSGQNLNLFAQIAAQQQADAAAAAANSVSYIPASRRNEIRASIVQKIFAVCHPIIATSGNGKTNHWTLSFGIGDEVSIGLDIQPNPQQPHTNGGIKAYIVISELDNVVKNHAVRYDPVSVKHQRPVSWYIDYLASGGRFRYAFTSEGIGCRQWITDTLKLLADAGEVNGSESESASRAVAYLWPDNCADEPAAGTYF